MPPKHYRIRANSLDAAYSEMRARFGSEASVVHTATVPQPGVLGWLGATQVELTVSTDAPNPQRISTALERAYRPEAAPQEPRPDDAARRAYYERLVRDAQRRMHGDSSEAGEALPAPPPPRPEPPKAPQRAVAKPGAAAPLPFPEPAEASSSAAILRRELHEIREMVQVIYAENPDTSVPAEFAPHYRMLIDRGVSRRSAAVLLGAVLRGSDPYLIRDPRVFTERLRFEIRRRVRATGGLALHGGTCRRVAVCGPTGVGKTTTLAKLAAHFAVRHQARVAMVSADTYRVAAAEQLRVYANIIGVPLVVVDRAEDIEPALDRFRDMDLVLLDSAGGSQFNLDQINDLRQVFLAARLHEVLLTAQAGSSIEDLRSIVANFACLRPTSLVVTKLDETRQYGTMLSLVMESQLPLSYAGIGQNVPDDIRAASPEFVAQLIMEGRIERG